MDYDTKYNEFKEYSSMYEQFMQLPLIQKLLKDNKQLMKSNKKLLRKNENLIELLISINKKSDVCSCTNCKCNLKNKKIPTLRKKEPNTTQCCKNTPVDLVVENDEDVVVIKTEKKPNIVYEIVEGIPGIVCNFPYNFHKEEVDENEVKNKVVEEEEEEEEAVEEEEEEEEEEAVEEEEEAVEEVAEAVEEEAEEEVEEEVVEEEEEEEGEEVYEVTINGKSYYTTNEINGTIYAIDVNGELDKEVGSYVNSVPKLLLAMQRL